MPERPHVDPSPRRSALRRGRRWVAALALPVAVGLLVLLERPDESASQRADPARDVVSVAGRITPYLAGKPADPKGEAEGLGRGSVELRGADPDTGARHALMYFQFRAVRRGKSRVHRCTQPAPERMLRTMPIRPWGNCTIDGLPASPVAVSIGGGTGLPTTVAGLVSDDVTALRIDGPGGQADVPISEHRAFLVLYSRSARGQVTLSATLRDGTTRYSTFEVPPSGVTPGAAEARDPGGLPDWTAAAHPVTHGPRSGQTCVQIRQRVDPQQQGRRAGGGLSSPICGTFADEPVVLDATAYGPSENRGPFSAPPGAPRRLIVWGAASPAVAAVTVTGPDGPRRLIPAAAGRAFITVFEPDVGVEQITVAVQLRDGTTREYRAPDRVGAVALNDPPLEPRSPVRIRQSARHARTYVLTAALSRPARRFEITFLGREIAMKRVGTSDGAVRYRGVYDGTRGARRRAAVGRLYEVSVIRCAEGCISSREAVRIGRPR